MLKKIALGALLTGLVAVLVWGAVIRTNATGNEGAGDAGRHGQATARAATGEIGQGGGRRGEAAQATAGLGGGRWAQGSLLEQAPGGSGGAALADVQSAEWRTVQGTVITASDDLVEIRSATGEAIPFEGQPLRYAMGQGFTAEVGDALALSGFDEDGEFKIGQVTNARTGARISLRDASGRPGWAGRGRRG